MNFSKKSSFYKIREGMDFGLPKLAYEVNDLEPYISRRTLKFHHLKHHQFYINRLYDLVAGTKFENKDIETIIKVTDGPIFNFAAQSWNHTFYFDSLKPVDNQILNNKFRDIIIENFGSIEYLKTMFAKTAVSLFGAGWVWLVLNANGVIEIIRENNAGNPLRRGLTPLLACDLWEHAYYLDYQDRINDYVNAFWELVNWKVIEQRYYDAINKLNIYGSFMISDSEKT